MFVAERLQGCLVEGLAVRNHGKSLYESNRRHRAYHSAFDSSGISFDWGWDFAECVERAPCSHHRSCPCVLEQRLEPKEAAHSDAIVTELCVLERRGKLIYHAVKLSTISALMVCFVIAALFASSMLHYSIHLIVSGLFIAAMLASIVSLTLFLREVYFAIETFEIGLPAETRQEVTAGTRVLHVSN